MKAGKIYAKKDFPLLRKIAKGKKLIYLDSAATAQKPESVINAIKNYYETTNSNTHRSAYTLANKSTEAFENSRAKVANFINASPEEIIFTSGTTDSLNMLANSLAKSLKKGDEIVLTEMEHHSNLVPWQQLAKEKEFVLKFIKVTKEGNLDMADAKKKITKATKVVSVVHVSNVLGTINDIKAIAELAHSNGAVLAVDGAQSITHMPVDMKDLDCDFFAFSGHKLLGPMGIGVLYGKSKLLNKISPSKFGGGMISEVSLKDSKWTEIPWKFEAGTQNISGAVGLGAAVDYLNNIGMHNVDSYVQELTEYAIKALSQVKGVKIYGPKKRGALVSFSLEGIHPHDVSALLDKEGIAVRGGHMCAMPLVTTVLGINAVCRASFHIYNSKEDIDKLVEGLKKVQEVFKK